MGTLEPFGISEWYYPSPGSVQRTERIMKMIDDLFEE